MKIQDIIRNVLDIIDNVDEKQQVTIPKSNEISPLTYVSPGDDINRFKQIVDLADSPERDTYCNEPNVAYGDLDSVTINAGGGLNGPKHPADIRVKDPSATPHLIGQDFEQPSKEIPNHIIMIKAMRGL
jgi:hypothetical protein